MPIAQTLPLGTFNVNDNDVIFQLDVDDSVRAVDFRCINQSDQPAFGLVSRADPVTGEPDGSGVQYGGVCPAGQTTSFTIPITAGGKIQLQAGPAPHVDRLVGYAKDLRSGQEAQAAVAAAK